MGKWSERALLMFYVYCVSKGVQYLFSASVLATTQVWLWIDSEVSWMQGILHSG